MSVARVAHDLLQAKAEHGERRGVRIRADDTVDDSVIGNTDTTTTPPTPSSPRFVRIPPRRSDNTGSGASSAIHSLTSASTLSTLESKLDLSPSESEVRKGLLRDSVFHEWKDDAVNMESETMEDLQQSDPLGTQIWKLYHKQRAQLPNSERMENLTWRLMSMNLRRKELERQG